MLLSLFYGLLIVLAALSTLRLDGAARAGGAVLLGVWLAQMAIYFVFGGEVAWASGSGLDAAACVALVAVIIWRPRNYLLFLAVLFSVQTIAHFAFFLRGAPHDLASRRALAYLLNGVLILQVLTVSGGPRAAAIVGLLRDLIWGHRPSRRRRLSAARSRFLQR